MGTPSRLALIVQDTRLLVADMLDVVIVRRIVESERHIINTQARPHCGKSRACAPKLSNACAVHHTRRMEAGHGMSPHISIIKVQGVSALMTAGNHSEHLMMVSMMCASLRVGAPCHMLRCGSMLVTIISVGHTSCLHASKSAGSRLTKKAACLAALQNKYILTLDGLPGKQFWRHLPSRCL